MMMILVYHARDGIFIAKKYKKYSKILFLWSHITWRLGIKYLTYIFKHNHMPWLSHSQSQSKIILYYGVCCLLGSYQSFASKCIRNDIKNSSSSTCVVVSEWEREQKKVKTPNTCVQICVVRIKFFFLVVYELFFWVKKLRILSLFNNA